MFRGEPVKFFNRRPPVMVILNVGDAIERGEALRLILFETLIARRMKVATTVRHCDSVCCAFWQKVYTSTGVRKIAQGELYRVIRGNN